jgi:hypothetical protein
MSNSTLAKARGLRGWVHQRSRESLSHTALNLLLPCQSRQSNRLQTGESPSSTHNCCKAIKDAFAADFSRKFVENEKGKPKAIRQLATACRAILAGEVKTANSSALPVIYPVFISDEPIVEATFSNAYFNEEFQKEGINERRVKPLTVMSTDEIEQSLPHVADNDFTWEELLQTRFNEFGVYPHSVGQAIYDLLLSKGLSSKQNQALKAKSDDLGDIIRRVFQKAQVE